MFRLVVALLLAGQASATTVSGDTFERDVASEDFAQHSYKPLGVMPASGSTAEGLTMQCTEGDDCSLNCQGYRACAGATLRCPTNAATTCRIVCDGFEACVGLTVLEGTNIECLSTRRLVRLSTLQSLPLTAGATVEAIGADGSTASGILTRMGSAWQPIVQVSSGTFDTLSNVTAGGISLGLPVSVEVMCSQACLSVPAAAFCFLVCMYH